MQTARAKTGISMGKLVVSLDGVVIKEVQITKDKTTLGRRPYNDIVIDNLAVSGEHAVLQMVGADVFIEDLNSTNGTYINGKAIKKQLLAHNDTVEIGKYKIKYLVDESGEYEKTMIMRPGAAAAVLSGASHAPSNFGALSGAGAGGAGGGLRSGSAAPTLQPATIKVLNGAAAGREVARDAVGQEADRQHMVQVRVADQNVVDRGQRVERQVADPGAGIDEQVVPDQERSGSAAGGDRTRAAKDANTHGRGTPRPIVAGLFAPRCHLPTAGVMPFTCARRLPRRSGAGNLPGADPSQGPTAS